MKHIPKTIIDMTASESMTRLIDRSAPLDESLVKELISHWRYDLYSRRPGPAVLENGVLKPTNLDLACFLSALADRGAVINLPTYVAQRPKTEREGERAISAKNRHGKVMGLVSNESVFSFGLRIEDHNVVTTDSEGRETVGAPRTFMLVGFDGEWSSGWRAIEFVPSAKENDFLESRDLWTGNTVFFENFVHPLRWTAFYGQYYFLTKVVIERLATECSWMRARIKSSKKSSASPGTPHVTTEAGVSREFPAFEVEIDAPWSGEFADHGIEVDGLSRRLHRWQWEFLPALRLAARATEYAFREHGQGGFPAWISGAKWERGYRQKGKRTDWNRFMLNQTFPGEMGFALRYRSWMKKEKVAR